MARIRRYKVYTLMFLLSILLVLLSVSLVRCFLLRRMVTYVYAGRGYRWMGIYTVTETNGMYYEALTIQYLYNDKTPVEELRGISTIEYILTGQTLSGGSSGTVYLDEGYRYSAGSAASASVRLIFGREVGLTIKWGSNEETFKLKRIK